MLMVAVGSQNSNLIYKRSVVSQVTRQVAMLWPAITQHGKFLAVTMILDKPGLLYRSCAYCSNISRNSCIQTSSDRTANLNVMYNISLRIPICIGLGSFAWGLKFTVDRRFEDGTTSQSAHVSGNKELYAPPPPPPLDYAFFCDSLDYAFMLPRAHTPQYSSAYGADVLQSGRQS